MSMVHVESEHLMDHRLSSNILDDRNLFVSFVEEKENYWASSHAPLCSYPCLFCRRYYCGCMFSSRRVSLFHILVPVQLKKEVWGSQSESVLMTSRFIRHCY